MTTGPEVILPSPQTGRRRQQLGANLSFLDEPDEPARRPPRTSRRGGGPSVDRQTLVARRTIAIGVGLVVLILLVLGLKSCLGARQDRAMKDYVREVTDLVQVSNQQGEALFRVLRGSGGRDQAVDLENNLNQFALQSGQLVDRARELGHPGDVDTAQDHLIETLEFRRDGVKGIATNLPKALGDQSRREGTDMVTTQMQLLLSSDVIYSQRFTPELTRALQKNDLADEVRRPASSFVPDVQWLDPSYVSERVSALRTGNTGGSDSAAPGLHGNGIGTVSLGGQALTSGGSTPATVTLSDDLTFEVQVVNQGDNTETDVTVNATIGRGDDAIELDSQLDSIASGETKTVSIPVNEQPPTGQSVPVVVEVEKVSGEEKTDNNRLTGSAIFTR
jgi:CARDB protein